jgi:hypothetical protein
MPETVLLLANARNLSQVVSQSDNIRKYHQRKPPNLSQLSTFKTEK